MEQSIYDLICAGRVGDSVLPSEFSLPPEAGEAEQGIAFADGALDGITMFHSAPEALTEDARQRMGELILAAGTGRFAEAEAGFQAFCKAHRVITIIDELQRFIVDHEDDLDFDKLYAFAVHLLLESKAKECVKVGLSILEVFETWDNEALAGAIRRIGLSDEFTLFSLFCMQHWPAADAEIFELAKRVRGWGRVHCVAFIETEDPEIKEWLLLNGVDNDVLPAYTAWPVYQKADVARVLDREKLSYEEVHALLALTEALLDEGPVRGISNMEDPQGYLEKVLAKARGCAGLTEEDQEILHAIEGWGKGGQGE